MYADDSSFFLHGLNLDNIIEISNSETVNILNWLEVNRLSLNVKKSNGVRRHKGQNRQDYEIKIKDETIIQVEHIKFLGIILDERLSWKEHALYVGTKLANPKVF